jgi:multimeric flavodoxin WrbA
MKCVVDDDTTIIYTNLQDMDALVIATPIYFYSMSGWLMAIVDRMYALIDGKYISRLQSGKKLYAITMQEEPDPPDGEAVIEVLSRAFKWVGMELSGSLWLWSSGGRRIIRKIRSC